MPDLSYIAEDLRVLARPLDSFKLDPKNARDHDSKSIETIKRSLKRFGQRKNIVVRKDGMVAEAGNGTITAARELGWTHLAAIIEDDDASTATAYGLMDNRSAEKSIWDDDVLIEHIGDLMADGWGLEDVGFEEWGDAVAEAQQAIDNLAGLGVGTSEEVLGTPTTALPGAPDEATPAVPSRDGSELTLTPERHKKEKLVVRATFADADDWGVPMLDLNMQAEHARCQVERWGRVSRHDTKFPGIWHAYTADYKFSGLWAGPEAIPKTGCYAVVEPNFSTFKGLAHAEVLWGIYRKRWLARYWQAQGVRTFVDVCVWPEFREMNLRGVPKGWRAYATRGYSEHYEQLGEEHELACAHAGTDDILFLVVTGAPKILDLCEDMGWVGVQQENQVVDAERRGDR